MKNLTLFTRIFQVSQYVIIGFDVWLDTVEVISDSQPFNWLVQNPVLKTYYLAAYSEPNQATTKLQRIKAW